MATISRVTTWTAGQVLTASAQNAEFDNIVNAWNNQDAGTSTMTAPKAAALTMTGNITFTPTTKGIVGTTTNDAAEAANVGAYISSSITSNTNFPTTNQYGDLTTISLTAGDWDISLTVNATLNGATCTAIVFGVGTVTGNSNTGLIVGDTRSDILPPTTASDHTTSLAGIRKSIAGTTTYYLKYLATFSAGTPQASGRISARRVR